MNQSLASTSLGWEALKSSKHPNLEPTDENNTRILNSFYFVRKYKNNQV